MKRVVVAFGAGVTPSGIGPIGENIVKAVKDVCSIQRTDVIVFSGCHKRMNVSEAFLMKKNAEEHFSVKVPILVEENEKFL